MAQKTKKILPIKVWLDEDSCWNNKPQYSEGYVEYVREDYHAQALLHVLNKGVKQGNKEMLEKAIEWLEENLPISDLENEHYVVFTNENKRNFIENLKKTMEGQI